MKELQVSKSLLSAYFFASVFFYYLISNLSPLGELVTKIQWWIFDFINTADTQKATADMQAWLPWLTLFLASFVLIFIIKNFIVEPMQIHLNDSYAQPVELAVLAIFSFGAVVYLVNTSFPLQLMPSVTPDWVVKLFGGISESVTRFESRKWDFVPWLWTVGPLVYIYLLHKKG